MDAPVRASADLSSFQHSAFDNTSIAYPERNTEILNDGVASNIWASKTILTMKFQGDGPENELDKAITVVNGHGYNCRANLSLHIIVPSTLLFQLRYIVIIATPKLPCIHPPSP